MSPELELLDQLEGGPFAYLTMERHPFSGDRARALGSIERMQREGLIVVLLAGEPVPGWMLGGWRRTPDDPATTSALERVRLEITGRGLAYLNGPDPHQKHHGLGQSEVYVLKSRR
jgi:hypothetical protein